MLRTSSYTIFVKLQDQDEDVLLVHGYTGAYDRVSSAVAAFLRSREAKRQAKPLYGDWSPEPEPPAAAAVSDATIDQLREQGYLTELSLDEEENFFSALAMKLHERALRQAPSFIFMPTYDCNLRCSYCYQDHMRTDCNFKHLLRSMRKPVVDRIFAALPQIEELHGLAPRAGRRRNIGFFGGEPLLAAHREIVEHILGKAFEMGEADLWAVTNGTEIDAYRDLLGPAGISHLQITLDGPQQEHDKRRIYGDGSGSSER
ncbi:MAG TPA: radical SAM protein, partial [Thermoanaerobaculia bacterium]|nr:radical SAM protein [Thermoanaerobaculia bacterium]